ncbi:MAG: LacI family transcriptional regulator, partial [Bacteroidetes bacterium]|nr:LacI family transcriptional regulator [Bacteroidota bacterium]
ARALKLSPSTVSKALNGAPEISPDTRKRVKEKAKTLNYAPNQVAQSLRSNKTHILGVIVPNLVSHFFSASLSGMQDAAAVHGYNLMVCQSNESVLKEKKLLQTLIASRVDGLLISLSKETNDYQHIQAVADRGIPLLLFDRTCDEINTSKVTVDDWDGAFKATTHLLERGFRRIAHISGPPQLSISKKRLAGYREAHYAYGVDLDEQLICYSNLQEEDITLLTHKLLDLPNPPDALFAINDGVAIRAMLAIKSRGLKIPENIALVGFTNTPDAALVEPSLTTISQPSYQLGKIAANHIMEQIQQPVGFMTQSIMLRTELVVRDSTEKPASRPAL